MEKKRVHFASTETHHFPNKRNHPYIKNDRLFKRVYKSHTFIKTERGSKQLHDSDWRRRHESQPHIKRPYMGIERPSCSRKLSSDSGRRKENVIERQKPELKQQCFTEKGNPFDFKTHVMEMIVTDLHTPTLVEGDGFQHLIKALNGNINGVSLNACSIRQQLQNMYRNTKCKVKNAVQNAKDPVLSAEVWTSSKAESYLTVTCHFIDKHWELKSYTLDTAQLLGEQTPENVHRQLWRISTEWDVMEKVQVVVINLDKMKKDHLKSNWLYIPCFSHTLNKVILEVINNTDWGYLLNKCRRIVQFFHQESKVPWGHTLVQSTCVCWISILNMVQKICDQWPVFSEVPSYKYADQLWLNENERKLLQNITEALTVVKNVTWDIGLRGYASISNIIPLLEKLQFGLESLKQQDNKVAVKLCKNFNYHFGKIQQIMPCTLSTAMDPRFKSSVLKSHAGQNIKTRITEEMCKQDSSDALGTGHHTHTSGNMSCEHSVLQYSTECDVSTSQNPLHYWRSTNKCKHLAMLAHKYLSVISTAVPIQRMKREDKSHIIYNRRKCLELNDINVMLFLNANLQNI